MAENVQILPIRNDLELRESLGIIHDSFITVANDLGLTPENAATNPAFLTFEKLIKHYAHLPFTVCYLGKCV